MLAHTQKTVIDKKILTYPKPKGLKGASYRVQADLMSSLKSFMVKIWDEVIGITKAMMGFDDLLEQVENI